MWKINDLKTDQLKTLLRERELQTTGTTAELVKRLIEFENNDEIEMTVSTSLQQQIDELRGMLAQMMQIQTAAQQQTNAALKVSGSGRANNVDDDNDSSNSVKQGGGNENGSNDGKETTSNNNNMQSNATTSASVETAKEIANVLPDFDPTNEESLTAEQFIDRVAKVKDAYNWNEKLILLALHTKLKGVAKIWLDSSPALYTTWATFASALRSEFGCSYDEAHIHYTMANATRRAKESVYEYCFRMSALGHRYNVSEAAIIKYARTGLKHRELQLAIAATKFATMKEMRDALQEYFVNRSKVNELKPPLSTKRDKTVKANANANANAKATFKCYNCGEAGHISSSCLKPQRRHRCTKCNKVHAKGDSEECQEPKINVHFKSLKAANYDECFKRTVIVQSKPYTAFFDTGSQCSIVRETIARQLNGKRIKCWVQIKGICGGNSNVYEAIAIAMEIDGKVAMVQTYIVDDNILQYDFLLGQDVLMKSGLTFKFGNGQMIIQNRRMVHSVIKPKYDFTKLTASVLESENQRKLRELLERFSDTFSTDLDSVGRTSLIEATIEFCGEEIISEPDYEMTESQEEELNEVIRKMLGNGILAYSESEFASPLVLSHSSSSSDQLNVDYRSLNKMTKKQMYPMPNIEQRLQKAKKYKYYTVLDLNRGYYQITIEPESRKYTAFVVKDTIYEFQRMPYGLKNAPAIFERLMTEVHKCVHKNDMMHYLDEVVIGSNTFNEMYEKLGRVLQALYENGITLNPLKCQFFKDTINFLGHELHPYGISPSNDKLEAISEFMRPRSFVELRKFLGMCGYFRKFIPGYAIKCEPLRKLLTKHEHFFWRYTQQAAFDKLKTSFTTKPMLAWYRANLDHELHTEASALGVTGAFMQRDDGALQPLGYYSRAIHPNETKLQIFELEAVAIVETLERFRPYAEGKKMKIVTDCNALKMTMSKKEIVPWLARWWLRMQIFDIDAIPRRTLQVEQPAAAQDILQIAVGSMRISKILIDEAARPINRPR